MAFTVRTLPRCMADNLRLCSGLGLISLGELRAMGGDKVHNGGHLSRIQAQFCCMGGQFLCKALFPTMEVVMVTGMKSLFMAM
jgi:hypothetical protein